jgi:ParB family chromosome partitioning protein
MELRRVDPRIIKANPGNPRKIQPGDMSDATLAASIQAVGILQPPAVTEKNGELTVAYGARRLRTAIKLGLPEIDVLVKDPDDHDQMLAVSENVVRAPMATVDLWRSIESLAAENWTEEAIASALLATVHPAILDQVGAGDMPKEQELRTIASAFREDQASVWKRLKPKKGEGAIWWKIAQALEKTRFFARDAKFGEDERAAFGSFGTRTCSPKGTRTIASPSTARPSCPLSLHGSTPTCPRTASCSTSTNTAAKSCRPRRNAPGRSRGRGPDRLYNPSARRDRS